MTDTTVIEADANLEPDETTVSTPETEADEGVAYIPEEGSEEGESDASSSEAETEDPSLAAADEDLVEVEHNGAKIKVPKDLYEGNLRHQDYTRKTMEHAEQVRSLETDRGNFTQLLQNTSKLNDALMQDVAALGSVNRDYSLVDQAYRAAVQQGDTQAAQQYWLQRQDIDEQRKTVLSQITAKQGEIANITAEEQRKALEQQRANHARQIEEGQRVLARDIPGWSGEHAAKLNTFAAAEFGFTKDELSSVIDPRMIKVLNAAFKWNQTEQARKAQTKATVTKTAQPVRQVGGATAATRVRTTDSSGDKLSTDQWMKAERARLARKSDAERQRFNRV